MDSGDDLRSRYRMRQNAVAPGKMQAKNQPTAQSKQSGRPTGVKRQSHQAKDSSLQNKSSIEQKSNRTVTSRGAKDNSKRTKGVLIVAAATIVIGGAAGAYFYQTREDGPRSLGVATDEADVQDVRPVEELSFSPLYPEDYEQRGIVFAQRQRGDTDYVSYTDVLDGVPFTVTQQRATEEVAGGDLRQLENLGRSMPVPAEEHFRANETPVFIGTDNEGRQSLVFTKEGVLAFVYAENEIREFTWVTYIDSLVQ